MIHFSYNWLNNNQKLKLTTYPLQFVTVWRWSVRPLYSVTMSPFKADCFACSVYSIALSDGLVSHAVQLFCRSRRAPGSGYRSIFMGFVTPLFRGDPEHRELNPANSGILAGFTPFLVTPSYRADISRDPTGCFTWVWIKLHVRSLIQNWLSISLKLVLDISIYESIHNWPILIQMFIITFDLQQNLPVPTLTHSAMFYLRQLWVYNFGIHECSGGNGIVCVE